MKLAFLAALVMTVATTVVSAKGLTTRITLKDAAHQTSVEMTDQSVVTAFNLWAGPGTFSNGVEGTTGFIIDWQAGIARDRPDGLARYEVSFHARFLGRSTEEVVYVVFYEHDPSSGRGFVYLPGRSDKHFGLNVRTILHGGKFEGHWFYATDAWQNAVDHLLPVTTQSPVGLTNPPCDVQSNQRCTSRSLAILRDRR